MEQRLVDKKDLTEQEIRTRYITPAIRDDAGWPLHQIREDVYLTDGQIHPRCEHASLCGETATGAEGNTRQERRR